MCALDIFFRLNVNVELKLQLMNITNNYNVDGKYYDINCNKNVNPFFKNLSPRLLERLEKKNDVKKIVNKISVIELIRIGLFNEKSKRVLVEGNRMLVKNIDNLDELRSAVAVCEEYWEMCDVSGVEFDVEDAVRNCLDDLI